MLQITFVAFDFLDNTEHTGYQFCQFRWILILFAYFIILFSVLHYYYVIPFVQDTGDIFFFQNSIPLKHNVL